MFDCVETVRRATHHEQLAERRLAKSAIHQHDIAATMPAQESRPGLVAAWRRQPGTGGLALDAEAVDDLHINVGGQHGAEEVDGDAGNRDLAAEIGCRLGHVGGVYMYAAGLARAPDEQ